MTDESFFELVTQELAGALVPTVELSHLALPADLAARVAAVTAQASREMS